MSKKWNGKILSNLIRVGCHAILMLAFVYFIFYSVTQPAVSLEEDGITYLTGFVTTTADGYEIGTVPDQRYAFDENRVFEMRGKLPEELPEKYRQMSLFDVEGS